MLSHLKVIEEVSVCSIFGVLSSFFGVYGIWTLNFYFLHYFHIQALYWQALFSTGFIILVLFILAEITILFDVLNIYIKKNLDKSFILLQGYIAKPLIYCKAVLNIICLPFLRLGHYLDHVLFEKIKSIFRPYYQAPISIQHFVHYFEFNQFKEQYKDLFIYAYDKQLQQDIIFSCKEIILNNFLNKDAKLLLEHYYKIVFDLHNCKQNNHENDFPSHLKEGKTYTFFCRIIFIIYYLSKIESQNELNQTKEKVDNFKQYWVENKSFSLFDTFNIDSISEFSFSINKIDSYRAIFSGIVCFIFLFSAFFLSLFITLFMFQYFKFSYNPSIGFSLLTFAFLFSFIIRFLDEDKWWWFGKKFLILFYKKNTLNKLFKEQYQSYIKILDEPLLQKRILFYLKNLIFCYYLEPEFHTQDKFLKHIKNISFYLEKKSYPLVLVEFFALEKMTHYLNVTSKPFIRYEEDIYTYTKSQMLHDKIFNDLENNKTHMINCCSQRQKI